MKTLNRRQFARGTAAGLLLAPFVSMFDRRPAAAATTKQAKRILFFCTMGTNTALWSPTNVKSESSFTFSEMTKPLEAIKDRIVMVEGLPAGNPKDGHSSPEGLCARGNGYYAVNNVEQKKISADEFISQALIKAGTTRPIPSLLLGAATSGNGMPMLWKNDKVASITASPSSAFTTVFGSTMPTGSKPDAVQMRRKSILDAIKQEVGDVQKLAGPSEKAKLDLHLESLSQLEKKLSASAMVNGMCNQAPRPPTASGVPCADDVLHMDIIINAFACDITRVAAVQFGGDQGFPVDLPEVQGDYHQAFLHGSTTDFTRLILFEKWLAGQFARVVKALQMRPSPDDPSKTLLDDTLVVWARDMGEAAITHNMDSMRFVLAGANYLKTSPTGRYLDLRAASNANGANRHERLLLNCMEAMGITSYAGFGDPNLATKTPLSNIAA